MIKLVSIFMLTMCSLIFAEMAAGYRAITRVEMLNGDTLEGALVIATAKGSVSPFYDQNGIMYLEDKYVNEIDTTISGGNVWLFGSDLFRIETYSKHRNRNEYSGYKRVKRVDISKGQLFFVVGLTSAKYNSDLSYQWETKMSSDSGGIEYEKVLTYKEVYKFVKEIELYPNMQFDYDSSSSVALQKPIVINIDNIKSLELLVEISEEWQNKIAAENEKMSTLVGDWAVDIVEPAWYHKVVKTAEERETANIFQFRSYHKFLLSE